MISHTTPNLHRGPIGLSSNYMSGGSNITFDPGAAVMRNHRLSEGIPFSEQEAHRHSTLDRLQILNSQSPLSLGKGGSQRGTKRAGSVHFEDEDLNDRQQQGSEQKRQSLQSFQYFRA